ncbi:MULTISPECIES: formylglycine-generating enzyme family protein [Trichocoleus]|uniref:Formylglycine-generating enzyme family protein n=1 Tax=Trichocoleus desertorum GB2-A4 TaxID=2933944 RepID=A0ABV0JF05_9CYAN|nr:formylglycine-generating enzyme family protein [Trichocoleus sp. FACHB-46]MBD1865017.1 formylglycine-generating enzyme family protein [Trichocoleus sp. FACHB-46]
MSAKLPEASQEPTAILVINRRREKAQYFVEDLGKGVTLDMVLIPAGNFMMGSPPDELERKENEEPQHQVTIQKFFLGKYAVTQAQWRAVAALPQVNQELSSDPSEFKGDNRPVEQITWFDAVEFCDRLSRHTNRQYRLPSEAEWEYACRAGTITPFHFGETITTDLANYRGEDDQTMGWLGSYDRGPKGVCRQETTPVGNFAVANAFGLYDMHGNVWEWCAGRWHENYEGAPVDGSAWVKGGDSDRRVLRGGSWYGLPQHCRSAYRDWLDADSRLNYLGFRVACSA